MYSRSSPYGNLYNTNISLLQTVHFVQNSHNLYLYNMDHLPITDSTLGPMEFNIHIISSTSDHLPITDSTLGPMEFNIHIISSTCIIQTPFYYRQYTLSKSVQNSYNLYLYNMRTSLLGTVLGREGDQNSHNLCLCNTDTSLLQTVLGPKKSKIHINSTTAMQTLRSVPLLSALQSIYMYRMHDLHL